MDTIDETRLKRLAILIKEKGSQAELARTLGKAPAQISQWVNRSVDAKTNKPRVMDSDSAREIESKMGLERAWMDQPVEEAQALTTWPLPLIPLGKVLGLNAEERGYLQGAMSNALKDIEAARASRKGMGSTEAAAHSGNEAAA